eukprot:3934596-Rhodomonas_salina.1
MWFDDGAVLRLRVGSLGPERESKIQIQNSFENRRGASQDCPGVGVVSGLGLTAETTRFRPHRCGFRSISITPCTTATSSAAMNSYWY